MEPNWETVFEKTEAAFGSDRDPKATESFDRRFNVSAYLTHYNISHKIKTNGAATYYQLDHCVFDTAHVKGAAIIQDTTGKLAYHCFHDSCKGKTWQDARKAISGSDTLKDFMSGNSSGTKQEKEKNQDPQITLVTLGEIHRMQADFPEPLIDGLLEQGDSLLITGPTGLGKSLLLNSLELSVAAGKRLFDRYVIAQPTNVLILQSENSLKATKTRLEALIDSYRDRIDFSDYVAALDNIFTTMIGKDCRISGDLLDPIFQRNLKDMLEATKAGLLILDPLISYHAQDENDNVGMRKSLDILTGIVGENTSVVITHHHGKGQHEGQNMARGATAILDWARGILTLTRQPHENKALIKVDHTKAGNFQSSPSFLLEVAGPCVIPVELEVLAPPSKIVEVLRNLGGSVETQNEFVRAIMEACAVSRKTAQDAINRTEEMGLIRELKRGRKRSYETV
jgi:hypothetical protein